MILDNYPQTHRLTKCLLLEMVSHLKILTGIDSLHMVSFFLPASEIRGPPVV